MSIDAYSPAAYRFDNTPYRRVGRSGLHLPPISLGLWQNFGESRDPLTLRTIVRRAFDLGVTHFDLANNYGPPPGSAETHFGRILEKDFGSLRDEMVISTKAGYQMWDGPYGDGGSRKYLLSSLDQSLGRLGLDYVDIFYHHREDPDTPLEETMGALAHAVRSGKALYAGISNYSPEKTRLAARILEDLGTPLLIHQPSYSMFNRHIENGLLDTVDELGVGLAAFSPLQQGLLTNRYMSGVPQTSRAGSFLAVAQREAGQRPEVPAAGAGPVGDRPRPRPEPGADGARVGTAASAGVHGAGGCFLRPPARAEHRHPEEARLHR